MVRQTAQLAAFALATILLVACAAPTARTIDPASPSQTEPGLTVSPVVTNLDTPWALAFAPDGRLFFTERPGRVRVVKDGNLLESPVITLPVQETAEGGVMGLAVDPGFPDQPYLYVMYSYQGGEGTLNRVARLRLDGDRASEDSVLLDGIPGANIHNGGRVKFGPDGLLYITTGDAASSETAQDPQSLSGKILRIARDGSTPQDNPFPNSPVYSLGHRNPQGLAWQPRTGRLYATEHGPTGNDEVNLIEAGGNYGWPQAEGEQHGGFNAPLVVYSTAIAPTGAVFYNHEAIPQWTGDLFFTTLRGEHLHRIRLDPGDPSRVLEQERLYQGEYGRLRDVVLGPDGALYVATSNRDGRGSPGPDDDRILRIGPAAAQGPLGPDLRAFQIGPLQGQQLLYPDLRTLVPEDLQLGTETVDGTTHHLVRFSNTIWNAGEGPLEVRETSSTEARVLQRVYDNAGGYVDIPSGNFEFHEDHEHWHIEGFARYELWRMANYSAWLGSGRTQGTPDWQMEKTGFCLMDLVKVEELPGSPSSSVYPTQCGRSVQGISVGWGDVYTWRLADQWVDVGTAPLPDGEYVLRSVADPLNVLQESDGGGDPGREGEEPNEAAVAFLVRGGRIAAGQ